MPEIPEEPEETRKAVLRLAEEIAELPALYPKPADYFREFLTRVLTAISAPAGAAYLYTPENKLQLQYVINLSQTGLTDKQALEAHSNLLRHAFQVARPLIVKPHEQIVPSENGRPATLNPTDYFIFLAPIKVDGEIAGFVEVFQDHDRAPNAKWGFFQFTTKMTEFASVYAQKAQKQKTESQRTFPRQRFVRGLVAVLAGFLVSGLAWGAARVQMYQLHYGWGVVDWTQGYTQYRLEQIDPGSFPYTKGNSKLPPSHLRNCKP